MKKFMVTSIVLAVVASSAMAAITPISLDKADWSIYTSSGSYGVGNSYGNLIIGVKGRPSHIGASSEHFNLQDATLQYKWQVDDPSYSSTANAVAPWNSFGGRFSTHHSYAGSTLINPDQWIYTEVIVNPDDMTLSYDYSYAGYGQGGLRTGSIDLTADNYAALADTYLKMYIGDSYCYYSTCIQLGEANIITEDGGPTIPAPGAILLAGIGIGIVRLIKRKRA